MACLFGCAAFIALWPYPENPKVPLLGGVLVGFGGSYVVTFCIAWARFGWRAARGMKIG